MSRPVYTIKRCDCTCADQSSPCSCAGSCLQCETKGAGPGEGASLTICGFAEYVPSSPPKYYKTESITGDAAICYWASLSTSCPSGGAGGDGNYQPDLSRRHVWAGSGTYDAACTAVSGDILDTLYKLNACEDDPGEFYSTFAGGIELPSDWGAAFNFSESATSRSWVGKATCEHLTGLGITIKMTGTLTKSLSNEATEAGAIAEMAAENDWMTGVCSALQTPREGVNFYAREARWRISKTGLTPSTEYFFTVTYWRRTINYAGDVGDWELYQTLELSDTTDGTGALLTGYTSVPNASGYETEARCDCVFSTEAP